MANLGLNIGTYFLNGCQKISSTNWAKQVTCDERGDRRQVRKDCPALSHRGTCISERLDFAGVFTQGRCHAGHPRSAESVKNDIPRLSVMEDVPHDGLVRNLGVIGVSVVDRIVLPFAYVRGKWFFAVGFSWIVRLPVVLDEILNKWIRAGRVVRRIGQGQDVLVRTNRESFDFAELGIFESLA